MIDLVKKANVYSHVNAVLILIIYQEGEQLASILIMNIQDKVEYVVFVPMTKLHWMECIHCCLQDTNVIYPSFLCESKIW